MLPPVPSASAVESECPPFAVALTSLPSDASAVALASSPEALAIAPLGPSVAASQVATAPSALGPDVTSVVVVEHDSLPDANASVRATIRAIETAAIAAPTRTIRVCINFLSGNALAERPATDKWQTVIIKGKL